jgi:hypothetical protein
VQRLFSKLARDEPELADLALFLSQAHNLKAVADYELGPGAGACHSIVRAPRSTRRRNSSNVLPHYWRSRQSMFYVGPPRRPRCDALAR